MNKTTGNTQQVKSPLDRPVMPEISVWHDWDSFVFWQPKNWRDFTLINVSGEIGPNRWYEIHIAFFGFHVWSQWLKA